MIALGVQALTVTHAGKTLVQPLDFSIEQGQCLAIIGESGSGKSLTARTVAGLLPRGVHGTGSLQLTENTIELPATESTWAGLRGEYVALLLQDPFTSLSPVHTCGNQLAATLRAEDKRRKKPRLNRAITRAEVHRRLAEVRLDPHVADQYPHELSGGMRQRVAIAAALSADPAILIADEPTTALDASVQAEVLDLLTTLCLERGLALLLISHDLGIVQGRAQNVMVMQNGVIVEHGPTRNVLTQPAHPYTRRLLQASPSLTNAADPAPPPEAEPLLEATGINKTFGDRQVLHEASVVLYSHETLALVGASGSGKSTLARVIAGLETPDSGSLTFAGRPLPAGRPGRTPDQIQVVFQDPNSTLNPTFTVGRTLAEALKTAHRPATEVPSLLASVELDAELAHRRPAQLSGGQRQRVSIARALAPQPRLLICDESVSALDVSVQDQILHLLERLKDELGLSILFISHDLAVVAQIADRVAVMRDGVIVETAPTATVINTPRNAYTAALVASARAQSLTKEPTS